MRRVHLLLFFFVAILFTSCSTGNKFSSSFGKRKYTKGYYVDIPSTVKIPSANIISRQSTIYNHSLVSNSGAPQIRASGVLSKSGGLRLEKSPTKKTITPISAHQGINQTVATEEIPEITKDNVPAKTKSNNSGEYNLFAIAGFVISTTGVVITFLSTTLTPVSAVLLIIGTILCIYSLFIYRIYFSWLAVVGLSLTIILLVLLLL